MGTAHPVGEGERKHPAGGNALLTTYDLNGRPVHTLLWLNQFATDLNLQLDSAQLKGGLSHRPIRLAERFLIFSTLWNVADRPKYIRLTERLKEHWAYNLSQNLPSPMRLTYYGADKTWLGFVENASVGYAVTDVILTYQFQMRIVPTFSGDWSKVTGGKSPFLPTSKDVKDWGPDWYTLAQFRAEVIGVGNENKKGSRVPGRTKHKKRAPWTGHGGRT